MPLTQWQARQKPRIDRELARIAERLAAWGAERVVLFGSHARGDFSEASDIDLFVVRETSARFLERIERALEVVDSEYPVEALVYTPAEYAELKQRKGVLIQAVQREGRVLYERATGRQRR